MTLTAPAIVTAAGRRRHYEQFSADIAALCRTPAVRVAVRAGRGRSVKDCLDAPGVLRRLAHGHGAARAHYTVAALIALADPLAHLRTPASQSAVTGPAPDPAAVADADPAPEPALDAYQSGVWRRRPNLGATLALAVRRGGWSETRTEDLLRVLVRVGEDQLHRRLPALAERLVRDGFTPDWPVLLDDLARRPFDRNEVATAWQDSFYLALPPARPRKDSGT